MPERLEHLGRQGSRQTQTTDDAAARREQGAAEAASSAQCEYRCGRALSGSEQIWEVQDPARLSTTKGIDRLIRISHHDDIAAVTGDDLQQPNLGGIGVLILIHEDAADFRTQRCHDLRFGEQDAAAVHELGVVQDAFGIEYVEVLIEEGSNTDPLLPPAGMAGGSNIIRIHAELPCLGEDRTHLASKSAGRKRADQ
jgi:hypothetical protein